MEEFGRWRPSDRVAFVASLQNKLGAYLSNPLLTGIFAQTKNSLDFRTLMDDGRQIVLINLSKGRMGADASRLLGSLIVSSLQTAALSRADMPESERSDFYIYLDEFSHFVAAGNETFAAILSESRKYRTGYTLVTQFIEQLDVQTRAAVFGNCGSLVAMQCGIDDARLMADQLGEIISPQSLTELPRFHAYARTVLAGVPSSPFALATPPPLDQRFHRAAIVRSQARVRHGVPRDRVQTMIDAAYG
jgi:type IV secretory pathway TraG/TraD family ATPase VirD4